MSTTVQDAEAEFRRSTLQAFEAQAKAADQTFDRDEAVVSLTPSGTTLATAPNSRNGSLLAYVEHGPRRREPHLKSGLYELESATGTPVLYHYESDAQRTRIELSGCGKGSGPVRLSTPAGDWLCAKADETTMAMCQDFAACAAYDLWC
jgi:hypothetical protein